MLSPRVLIFGLIRYPSASSSKAACLETAAGTTECFRLRGGSVQTSYERQSLSNPEQISRRREALGHGLLTGQSMTLWLACSRRRMPAVLPVICVGGARGLGTMGERRQEYGGAGRCSLRQVSSASISASSIHAS